MPILKKCVVCGSDFSVPPNRAETAKTCSNSCAVSVRAKSRERKVICKCGNCGVEFQVPASHSERRKYCSLTCKNGSVAYSDLIGSSKSRENNPMWRGGVVAMGGGYMAVRMPSHPFASNGYILEHRLVMESWLKEDCKDSKFLIEIYGDLYLSPGFDVHHLDEDKKNNTRDNLLVCTKQTHVLLHAGYGVNSGTFWPELPSIKIDNTSPADAQRARRKAQRSKKRSKENDQPE